MLLRILLFLLINFAALGLGGLFTNVGVSSDWYAELLKAPWTPPGWVFGAAWTTIMICFSFYLAALWPKVENTKSLLVLFGVQWVLNVVWNPIFFHLNNVGLGFIVISALTLLVAFIGYKYWHKLLLKSTLLLPYLIWLIIATSLNAYIFIYN